MLSHVHCCDGQLICYNCWFYGSFVQKLDKHSLRKAHEIQFYYLKNS